MSDGVHRLEHRQKPIAAPELTRMASKKGAMNFLDITCDGADNIRGGPVGAKSSADAVRASKTNEARRSMFGTPRKPGIREGVCG